jgi:hypothetical protein
VAVLTGQDSHIQQQQPPNRVTCIMNTLVTDNSNSPESLTASDDIELMELNILADDVSEKPVKGRRFNREARRKIEEYLENKRLDLLTRDIFSED